MSWNLNNGANLDLDLLKNNIGNEMFVQFAHKSCLPQIDILDHNSLIGYAGLLQIGRAHV